MDIFRYVKHWLKYLLSGFKLATQQKEDQIMNELHQPKQTNDNEKSALKQY